MFDRTSLAFCALSALVLVPHAAGAGLGSRDITPKSSPAQPGSTAVGGMLRVQQIATNDVRQLLEAWAKPTIGVSLNVTTRTVRGKPITTFLVFFGCAPDPSGNCNLTADFDVTDAQGKVTLVTKAIAIWTKPPSANAAYLLSMSSFGVGFDEADEIGDFNINVVTVDHVAGVKVRTRQTITLTR